MVRVKIAVKDLAKIPTKRVFEFDNKLYAVRLRVEGIEQSLSVDGDGYEGGDDDDADDLDDEPQDKENNGNDQTHTLGGGQKPRSKASKVHERGQPPSTNQVGGKIVPMWSSLFKEHEWESITAGEMNEIRCTNLLKDMELAESKFDSDMEGIELKKQIEEEVKSLPQEWCYTKQERMEDNHIQTKVEQNKRSQEGGEGGKRIAKKKNWGPIIPERRSTRNRGGGTMLEKAQAIKSKQNLEALQGNKRNKNSFSILSTVELEKAAGEIGLKVDSKVSSKDEVVRKMIEAEGKISLAFL